MVYYESNVNDYRIMNLDNIFKRAGSIPETPIDKALEFYRLSIEVERFKEPKIRKHYYYSLHYKSRSLLLVDLPCNKDFYDAYKKNSEKDVRFPLDLHISLKVKQGDVYYNLLVFSIDFSDIKDFDPDKELLPISIDNFEVSSRVAFDMELSEGQIEAVNKGFHKGMSMDDVRTLLKTELGDRVYLQDGLYLALSAKSIDLAQLYSELNSARWKKVAKESSLLKNLLTSTPATNIAPVSLSEDTMLKVTSLDDAQSKAVITALCNPVSVITGPPGTGKTQVIQNILANALALGKTAIVASKTNKAVDNVNERFDLLDSYGYLLRFGAKEQINNISDPSMTNLVSLINKFQKDKTESVDLISEYHAKISVIDKAKSKLTRLSELLSHNEKIKNNIAKNNSKIDNAKTTLKSELNDLDADNEDIAIGQNITLSEVDPLSKDLSTLRLNIKKKCSGRFGFWYRIFSVSKCRDEVIAFYDKLPAIIKGLDSFLTIPSALNEAKKINCILEVCKSISTSLNRLSTYLGKRQRIINTGQRQLNSLLNKKSSWESERASFATELENLVKEKNNFNVSINQCSQWIKKNSVGILEAYVEYYLANTKQGNKYVENYQKHIRLDKPWKDAKYAEFVNDTKYALQVLRLTSITNLSVKNALPLSAELIDILIIDEASQCDVASALPLIARAKQIVVIGDPMQLKHISAVATNEEQQIKDHLQLDATSPAAYNKTSLWDFCNNYLSITGQHHDAYTILTHHYRCHPDIINYSNHMFYEPNMAVSLSIDTNISGLKATKTGLFIVPVNGRQENPDININEIEAQKCVDVASWLAKNNSDDVTIGVVTPFRHQAQRIHELLVKDRADLKDRIDVNTVYKYQGDEKDIMIYSPMVSMGSPRTKLNWIDIVTPNLVNVAVTRAKSALYVVCDADYIRTNSSIRLPLGNLISICNQKPII